MTVGGLRKVAICYLREVSSGVCHSSVFLMIIWLRYCPLLCLQLCECFQYFVAGNAAEIHIVNDTTLQSS